ncbi:hypothetical protein GGU10DRAFT_382465 [Lentinula aff. detonsa]|uniref:Uncharacterized protein n=1 Tax=Lentinula aff. detonsa TaxID=2804958 RepID=A0AA38NIC6_9AGAR|nr:hypothetical protein GGU10DRAFT_382465 [Lentinula aff. detonsa]
MALQFYGCSEKLKGDLVIFSLSKYQPERFLETFPRFKNAEEKQEVICRILTSFCKTVKAHIDKKAELHHIIRG